MSHPEHVSKILPSVLAGLRPRGSEDGSFVSCMGLPIPGFPLLDATSMRVGEVKLLSVPSLTVRRTTFQPCHFVVKLTSPGELKMVSYGSVPHVQITISPEEES